MQNKTNQVIFKISSEKISSIDSLVNIFLEKYLQHVTSEAILKFGGQIEKIKMSKPDMLDTEYLIQISLEVLRLLYCSGVLVVIEIGEYKKMCELFDYKLNLKLHIKNVSYLKKTNEIDDYNFRSLTNQIVENAYLIAINQSPTFFEYFLDIIRYEYRDVSIKIED